MSAAADQIDPTANTDCECVNCRPGTQCWWCRPVGENYKPDMFMRDPCAACKATMGQPGSLTFAEGASEWSPFDMRLATHGWATGRRLNVTNEEGAALFGDAYDVIKARSATLGIAFLDSTTFARLCAEIYHLRRTGEVAGTFNTTSYRDGSGKTVPIANTNRSKVLN
jgi:hypothetical protein